MYYTEELNEKLRDEELTIPLCIRSYKRPNAPIFTSEIIRSLPKHLIKVFIRKEEFDDYSWVLDFAELHIISSSVKDSGDTSEYIVNWAYEQGYNQIFLSDDTIEDIRTLMPIKSRYNKVSLNQAPFSSPYETLKQWAYLNQKLGWAHSVIAIKGYSWNVDNSSQHYRPYTGSGGNLVCLNTKILVENDCNYKSLTKIGVEDFYILWKLANQGFLLGKFYDYDMTLADRSKLNPNSGNNALETSKKFNSRAERLLELKKNFWKLVLNKEWPEKQEGIIIYKSKLEGHQIRLNFRYWRKKLKLD